MPQTKGLPTTEEELIKQLQSRQADALSLLYDRYAPILFGVIRRLVKDEELAQQVLLESFAQIWSSFAWYNQEVNTLSAWLIGIARDLALAHQVRDSSFRLAEETPAIDGQLVFHNRSSTAAGSKQPEKVHLPEQRCQPNTNTPVLDLLYFEGYTPMQVAQKLGIPLASINKKARAELKTIRNQA